MLRRPTLIGTVLAALTGVALLVGAAPVALAGSAPDFTLPDLDGQTHSLSQYRGKWVVLDFWATW